MLAHLLEKKPSSNAAQVTLQLVRKIKVPLSSSVVIQQIEEHPDFPSLFCISDSLKRWKIDNLALQIESDKLPALPTPFIAHKKDNENFVLVTSAKEDVYFVNEKGKLQQKTKNEFLKDWSGIVLIHENTQSFDQKKFQSIRNKEIIQNLRFPLILIGFLSMIFYHFLENPQISSFLNSSLLLSKFIGIITTTLLLWFEVDKNNSLLKQICTGGKKSNCTAVLGSKEAKIFNFLSWSEIGFFYFSGSFLLLLVTLSIGSTIILQQSIQALAWFNLIALPFIIYSLFYQWRVAKQWCPLCLTVQALLALEFGLIYAIYWLDPISFNLSNQLLYALLISFSLPIVFWTLIKPFLLQIPQTKRYRKELNKIKFDNDFFQNQLLKQKQITISPEGLGITLGNANAKHSIVKVCNPYCAPCAQSHPEVEVLLQSNLDVKIQVIYTLLPHEELAMIVKHFLALDEKGDPDRLNDALDEWYNSKEKNYLNFSKKFKIDDQDVFRQTEKLIAMREWCDQVGIAFTPTFFVNGYQLPKIYKISDLKYLL